MRITIFLLPLAVGLSCALTAQRLTPEVISVAGNFDHTDRLSLEWTLGQVATQTIGLTEGMLTQGFHQPLLRITGPVVVAPAGARLPNVNVFPNPVQGKINISVTGAGSESYSLLKLLDARGRVVAERRNATYQPMQQLDVSLLPAGSYQLLVAQPDGQSTQTFTVIKLN